MKNYSRVGKRLGKPAFRTPSSFKNNVYKVVSQIPKRQTLVYKEVAKRAGSPKAF